MNLVDQINIINNVPIEPEPHEPVPPRIKGLIITDINDSGSMYKARKCGISIEKTQSKIDYTIFPATLPSAVARDLKKIVYLENPELLPWTWPTKKEQECIDFKTGLYKWFDPDLDQAKAISNTVSHMRAWQYCIDINQPIIVMENNVSWNRKYDHSNLTKESRYKIKEEAAYPNHNGFNGGIVSLKTPDLNFRHSEKYIEAINSKPRGLHPIIPIYTAGTKWSNYPQSLIDSGTYLITPWASKKILSQIQDNGMWPANIILNRQLFHWIQVVKPSYTQGQT
jgi:hypothetical protein